MTSDRRHRSSGPLRRPRQRGARSASSPDSLAAAAHATAPRYVEAALGGTTAADRLARIVQLVAELSRLEWDEGGDPTLQELAASFGVSPQQIAADVRTLTLLGDHADAEWLLSLRAWQQEDRISVSSAGPFRRPVRLTPDELLAVQVALAMEPDGAVLAGRLAELAKRAADGRMSRWAVGTAPEETAQLRSRSPARPLTRSTAELLELAVAQRHPVMLRYAGEGDREAREWTAHPHQLFGYRDRTYLHAWCEGTNDWRHFRLDRMLDVSLGSGTFARREDFVPVEAVGDVFRAPDDAVEDVRVRFSPAVARWVRERYPSIVVQEDGSLVVTLRVSSVEWLVRRVLEYGADAEVMEPAAYREAMRSAVA